MSSPPPLEVRGLVTTYADVVAVDGIDLVLHDDDVLALVGPSGCGKSSLLRTIAGLVAADSGSIHLSGRLVEDGSVRLPPERRPAGLVFQEHALFPHLTVRDNVGFGVRDRSKRDVAARVDDMLQLVSLGSHGDRYPHELSGGERQRVALARALAPAPALMLFDEPFASLDHNLRVQLRQEVVAALRTTSTPAVFVTHDQREALAIADRIAVMRDGKVVQAGSPMELYRRPTTAFAASFHGETNLIEGELERGGTAGQIVELKTAMGVIPGTLVQAAESGARARVSIRPESLRTAQSGSISASIASTTYLGEVAHHRARHESGGELAISEFAPGPRSAFQGRVSLTVSPDDAVILVD